MAVIAPMITSVGDAGDGSAIRVVWTPVTEADSCRPVKYPKHSDKSIQVFGTFGGATVALNGSNDGGTTFAALNTPASAAIVLNAAGIKAVLENTEIVQPVATGGAGQLLTIAMLFHFSNPARQ
jgi:hypothetical protein